MTPSAKDKISLLLGSGYINHTPSKYQPRSSWPTHQTQFLFVCFVNLLFLFAFFWHFFLTCLLLIFYLFLFLVLVLFHICFLVLFLRERDNIKLCEEGIGENLGGFVVGEKQQITMEKIIFN